MSKKKQIHATAKGRKLVEEIQRVLRENDIDYECASNAELKTVTHLVDDDIRKATAAKAKQDGVPAEDMLVQFIRLMLDVYDADTKVPTS